MTIKEVALVSVSDDVEQDELRIGLARKGASREKDRTS